MNAFPFTKTEWAAVSLAALSIVKAGCADDAVIETSSFIDLVEILHELRAKYGEHPTLLETEADFTDDEHEQVRLYRRAVGMAEANQLQTLTIRLSLAQVLLDMGHHAEAHCELTSCQSELAGSDEHDRSSWTELFAETMRPRIY